MTNQTGKDAGGDGGSGKDAEAPQVTSDDLDLVEIDEDEGKSDQEIWNELDVAEGTKAAGEEGNPDSDKAAATDKDLEAAKADDSKDAAAVDDETETPDKAAVNANGKGAEHAKDGDAATGKKAEPTLEELKAEATRLREENRRLEQSERANRNRVSALQRKYESPRGVRTVQDGKKPAAKKAPFQDDKGKDFAKEYPEVAGPVAAELAEVHTELEELKAERTRREMAELETKLIDNEKVLDGKHPKWEEKAASAEFGDWLVKQPRYVQQAVRRNFDAIVDAAEAVDIFDRFEAFRSSQAGGEKNTQQHDGPSGKGGNAQADGKNGSSLSGKRQRQLDSSSGTKSTGPGLVDGVPEEGDPEAIWKAFDRMEERQERAARRA